MKPLDGAWLKVVRAKKHLNCLKAEVTAYLDTKPYEFPLRQDNRFIQTGGAILTTEPPLELGCIFGDCLNNLRSSLDYIAWELATKHTPSAILSKQGSSILFPLHKSAGEFATNGGPKLKTVAFPASVIDVIESVQPYQAGYESLGLLSDLVKTDKHRLPLLTIASAQTNSIVTTIEGGPTLTLEFSDSPGEGAMLPIIPIDPNTAEGLRILQHIQELQRQASSPGPPGEQPGEVKVDGNVAVFVSLKDFPVPNEPVDVTLSKIVNCVSDIIPRFESLFV